MNIRKGDKVVVISGDDRGSQGEVQRVMRAKWGKGRKAGQRKASADRVSEVLAAASEPDTSATADGDGAAFAAPA